MARASRREETRMTEALIVFTSFASEEDAARVVRTLVEERLAACGNLLAARSLYAWQGKIEDQRETVVILKTRKQDWTALLSRLHELHPYRVPECIAVRVAAGAPRYMAWLEETLAPEGS
jgi:periplasmic divalent cation tolerance protein